LARVDVLGAGLDAAAVTAMAAVWPLRVSLANTVSSRTPAVAYLRYVRIADAPAHAARSRSSAPFAGIPGNMRHAAEFAPVEVPIARFRVITPEAVVPCRSAADVVAVVGDVRRRGAAFAVRSGGHCFAGRSSATGMVMDVGPMDEVVAGDGVVTVGAGARLGQIYDALEPLGRTIAGGCGPTVGIAGLTLGGGLGIFGRRHGLTCDQLVAAEVVLADGSVVECDAHREPDLFWALRGAGGGQFGVVTRLTLTTVAAPPAITCFDLTWPHEAAAEIIEAWQEWSPDAPDEMAASLLADGRTVHVFGAGDGRPPVRGETETVVELPYREAKRWLAENGPADEAEGRFDYSKSEFFRHTLPASAVEDLASHLRDGPGERRELDFSPWAGAYNRTPTDATAFPHRNARFLLKQTISTRGEAGDDERRWLHESWEITRPYGAGGVYPNFPDPDLEDPLAAYHGTNLDRLERVKAAYDPDNFFRFPQSLWTGAPSTTTGEPSAVSRPPWRRSQIMSQWIADSFVPPVSGYERPRAR